MSLPVQNTDRAGYARGLLIDFFKGKPNLDAIIQSFVAETQLLENVFFQLLTLRGIETGSGVQLDGIGQNIGQLRGTLSDSDYQKLLRARVLINLSSGTTEQIYSTFRRLGIVNMQMTNEATTTPASFQFFISDGMTLTQANLYNAIVLEMTPAGVNGYYRFPAAFEFTYDIGPGYDTGVYSRDGV